MNPTTRSLTRWFSWAFLILVIAGVLGAFTWSCFSSIRPSTPFALRLQSSRGQQPTPSVFGTVLAFTLIDQAGQPFGSESLKGRVWIADFIFTSCAGSCPQMTEKMAGLQRKLPPEIQFVSISVDPDRDSPPVLAEYARKFGALEQRWHFLTGSPALITPLVAQGFRLSIAEGGSPEEPITHSIRFALIGRDGAIRGYYDSTDPEAIEQLKQDAVALLH